MMRLITASFIDVVTGQRSRGRMVDVAGSCQTGDRIDRATREDVA